MMWLDDVRGNLIDWATQRWVQFTGKSISLWEYPWLHGPVGKPSGIGQFFFDIDVAENGLRQLRGQSSGLMPNFEALRSPTFDPHAIAPEIVDFYTHTSAYDLDVWSQWTQVFRPFGWALAVIFSRRLQQLNVPLSNLDTSRGMTSEVIPIVDAATNVHLYTAWVRQLVGTGNVIYAGAYSVCNVPFESTPCVRIVFPLPNGNAIVLMRPKAHPDGSLSLISAGQSFGGPGFYFTIRKPDGKVWARYIQTFQETIHVYLSNGDLRTDHTLSLWGVVFLRLHYRLRRKMAV